VTEDEEEFKKASLLKDSLVDLAREKLPSRMGDKYTGVVVNCLTCLDEGNIDFGDQSEFEDADGISIGVRYIEKVSLAMEIPGILRVVLTQTDLSATEQHLHIAREKDD
jgi:hypothetical protein